MENYSSYWEFFFKLAEVPGVPCGIKKSNFKKKIKFFSLCCPQDNKKCPELILRRYIYITYMSEELYHKDLCYQF